MRIKKAKPQEQPGRRRPIEGPARPTAFSYYSQRSQSVERERRRIPEEIKKSHMSVGKFLGVFKQRVGLVCVALAVIAGLLNLVRLTPQPRIESLNTPPASYLLHSKNDYTETATALFGDSILNGNKLTINTHAIEAKMLATYPELTSATIALPLAGHRPVMYIRTAAPTFIVTSLASKSFVVDQNGKALIATNQVPNLAGLKLPLLHDESGLDIDRGHLVLSAGAVSRIKSVTAQFAASNIPIAKLTLPAAASELNVYPAGRPYYIKFNLQTDHVTQQTGTYLAVAERLSKQGVTPKEYIDVRVDGRAYYK